MNEFLDVILQLKSYLASLPHIRNDWISGVKGGAKAPTQAACAEASAFLDVLQREHIAHNIAPDAARLIMGPIPTGGVCAELKIGGDNLIVNFNNSGTMDMEMVLAGVDVDLEPSREESRTVTNAERSVLALQRFLPGQG